MLPKICLSRFAPAENVPHISIVQNRKHLSLGAPDVLQQTVTLSKAVHRVVALAHSTDETAQSINVVLSGDGAAVLVDLGDRNLDGAMVLGLDNAVGGAALAGDVARGTKISISVNSSMMRVWSLVVQVHDLATVVLHCVGFVVTEVLRLIRSVSDVDVVAKNARWDPVKQSLQNLTWLDNFRAAERALCVM